MYSLIYFKFMKPGTLSSGFAQATCGQIHLLSDISISYWYRSDTQIWFDACQVLLFLHCYFLPKAYRCLNSLSVFLLHYFFLYLAPRFPPRNITVKITGSRSLLINWDHLLRNDTNGIIINYSICIQQESSTPRCVNVSATDNVYIANGLKPYSNYTVEISAKNSAGFGPYNSGITKQTNEEGKYFVYIHHKLLSFKLLSCNNIDAIRQTKFFVVT